MLKLLLEHRDALVEDGREVLVGPVDLALERLDVDAAVGQTHQHAITRPALLPPGEDRYPNPDGIKLLEQRGMVLASKDLGRSE